MTIRINDFDDYIEKFGNNGGHYGYWTDYTEVENGFRVTYGTTSDIPMCECCGNFGICDCEDAEIILKIEMQEILNTKHNGDYIQIL